MLFQNLQQSKPKIALKIVGLDIRVQRIMNNDERIIKATQRKTEVPYDKYQEENILITLHVLVQSNKLPWFTVSYFYV